jgi:RNA polymerase sigma factor (TIGR02999 family)
MATTNSPEINQFLTMWGEGDRNALPALIPLLYDELRRVARKQLRRTPSARTLQTTALVHEAYLRLHQQFRGQFQNKEHFVAVCALLMRQILVGYEREKRAAKRGGGLNKCTLEDVHAVVKGQPVDLLDLDRALTELSHLDAEQGRLVELRFFGGLSIEETAKVLGKSPATVKRDWSTARIWLYHQLNGEARA